MSGVGGCVHVMSTYEARDRHEGNDLDRLRGIDDQSGREQAYGQEAAVALERAGRTQSPTGADEGAERRAPGGLRPVVPGMRTNKEEQQGRAV